MKPYNPTQDLDRGLDVPNPDGIPPPRPIVQAAAIILLSVLITLVILFS